MLGRFCAVGLVVALSATGAVTAAANHDATTETNDPQAEAARQTADIVDDTCAEAPEAQVCATPADRPPVAAASVEDRLEAILGADSPAQRPLLPLDQLLDGGRAPVAFCFAPGTPREVMDYYNELVHVDPGGIRYFLDGRWSGTSGSPRALTWSFVPDGLSVDGGSSELFSRMDSLFGGNRALWISKFEECFARWEELTGTSYTHIVFGVNDWDDGAGWGSSGSGTRGDIRISMKSIDGSSGVLAYNYFPSNGDMVLDRSENWGSTSNNYRFLRNVVMHEHGHGVGLYHVCSSNTIQLMEPYLSTAIDGLQHDDIRGGQRHYGDPFEDDNSPATATHIGSVSEGSPISIGDVPLPAVSFGSILSIDHDGEQDYFRFTVAAASAATALVTPIGRAYDSSPQSCGGSTGCCSGNTVDSLPVADLAVQFIGINGSTVLGTADSAPAGSPETLAGVSLLVPGDYYLRVYETNSPSTTQLYEFTLSVAPLDCNTNGILDACDVDCGEPAGECDVPGCGQALDCNNNLAPDECELSGNDCNGNSTPDDCESPMITQPPADEFVCPQTDASFQVSATTTFGSPSFEWYFEGSPLGNGGKVLGADTDTLMISSVGVADEGSYTCLVIDGCLETMSPAASLTLLAELPYQQIAPDSLNKCEGERATFVAAFGGDEPLSYQWKKDGVPINGANESSYTIPVVTEADAGDYECEATNLCGSALSDAAILTIDEAPIILRQPESQCVETGGTAMFSLTVPGAGPFYFKWYKDDFLEQQGQGLDTLTVTNAQPGDAGEYRATVQLISAPDCQPSSDIATLQVDNCPGCQYAVVGDMDDNGGVDLYDFTLFQACFGPGKALVFGCECANLDAGDNDINVDDFLLWDAEFTGP